MNVNAGIRALHHLSQRPDFSITRRKGEYKDEDIVIHANGTDFIVTPERGMTEESLVDAYLLLEARRIAKETA
jgi:hypothetical protein